MTKDLSSPSPDQESLQGIQGRTGTWTPAYTRRDPVAGMIRLSVGGITSALVTATMVLAAMGLLVALLGQMSLSGIWLQKVQGSLVRLLSLDLELNIPTWYNSFLLSLCSAFSAAMACMLRSRIRDRGRWLLMSVFFLGLSIDESASIHEMAIWPMQELFNTSGYLKYGWVVPGAILVVAVALYYLRFIFALPDTARFRLMAGAATFATGALVVEAITAKIDGQWGTGLAYELAVVVEETLEMLGLVIIISGLLAYLRSEIRSFGVEMVD